MKTNISVRLIGVLGALIPISVLIRTYFGLPTNGFFGAVLPTIAAVAVMCILIYAFVRERWNK